MRRELITDTGILVVGLASAVLTFTTLSALGFAVGFTGAVLGFQLAWLLPVVVDVAAIVAARVWLQGRAAVETVQYARRLAMTCIGLSVVFNGGWHILAAVGIVVAPWWVVLPVTSVPPAVLAAVVHLGHLLHRTPGTDVDRTPRSDAPSEPVRATVEVVRTPPSDARPITPDVPAIAAADDTEPAQIAPTGTGGTDVPRTTPELAADQPSDDPDPLLDQVVRWASDRDVPPSPTAVRTEFKVGRDRAVRLLDQLARTARPNAPSEEEPCTTS